MSTLAYYLDGSWHTVGGGIQIQDEGTDLTLRDTLNFTGDGVYAYDDGSGKTNVVIAGPGPPFTGIHYGTNTGGFISIVGNTNPSIGQVIDLRDNYAGLDSHGINISSDYGAIGIVAGLELDLIATDRGSTDTGRGLISLHAYSETLTTGIKIWMEHAGSPSSVYGGNHHIVIARTSSYGDVPGDVLMRIDCNADGTGVTYRIKSGASWVADL